MTEESGWEIPLPPKPKNMRWRLTIVQVVCDALGVDPAQLVTGQFRASLDDPGALYRYNPKTGTMSRYTPPPTSADAQ